VARISVWSITLAAALMLLLTGTSAQNGGNTSSQLGQKNSASDDSSQQAMSEDLERMQMVLNQMRTNLAFVGNNTSPLNHQFELEIDMWQMLIDQMKRRVAQVPPEKPSR